MWNLPLNLALWNDSQLDMNCEALYEKLQILFPQRVVNRGLPGSTKLIWFLKCSLKASFWNTGFYTPTPIIFPVGINFTFLYFIC